MRINNLFANHFLGVFLFLVTFYIAYANYTPNTFLTGWDTLHPEFNYRIYLSRILEGVWQEHQSLGAVATQAHASEIPRVLILMFLDLFLPMNMVRYAYAFLMLILGPLGVYAFIKYILAIFSRAPIFNYFSFRNKKFRQAINNGVGKGNYNTIIELAGFAGGLFYLFNLGTLQHFYVPLEMFLTHFGLLGWLFLCVVWFLREGSKKALAWFSVVSFFMVPQAHTPTLFYAFFLYLVVFLLTYFVAHKFNIQILKSGVAIITGTLVINMFWFLPNVYFALTHGEEIQQSKIHLLFSQEAFLQNKEFGNIKDTALLKSFLFNWGEYVGNNRYGDLLDEWKYHLKQPFVEPLGYVFFGFVILGLVLAIVKREKELLGVGVMFFVGLFFIFNVNPPLGQLFVWMQENIPLFKEAFRFPFTKFSIGLMFCYSVFFSYFVFVVAKFMEGWFAHPVNGLPAVGGIGTCSAGGRPPTRILARILVWLGFIAILFLSFYYYAKPMFNGGLISPSMRVAIPKRYFDMFDYFDKQKEYGRALNLPIHSMWGWVYHNWDPKTTLGYQGAGFLWFGIKQPLINREFDRWNLINEKPYMEISTAIYSEDIKLLEKLLDKYKIRWLILDQSVVAPAQDERQLFYPQIKALIGSSKKIKLEKDFGGGLEVYKYFPEKDFAKKEWLDIYYVAGDNTFKEPTDPIYNSYGNYAGNGEKVYPFVGITNYDESVKKGYISSDENNIYFNNNLGFSNLKFETAGNFFQFKVFLKREGENYLLMFEPVEESFDFDFSYNLGKISPNIVGISINDNWVLFLKDYGPKTLLLDPSREVKLRFLSQSSNLLENAGFFDALENCSLIGEQTSYSLERTKNGFLITARNVDACVTLSLKNYLDNEISKGLSAKGEILNSDGDENEGKIYQISVNSLEYESLNKQEICVFDEDSGLCVNPPLANGKTFFVAAPNKNYNLRLFARGKKSPLYEVKVEYSNLGLYELKSERLLTFKPELNPQKGLIFGRWKFEKDHNYSGNASSLNNYPRICNTGETIFNKKSKVSVLGGFGAPFIRYESYGEALCDSFEFPVFDHSSGAVLEIKSRNVIGMPLRVCLTNEYSKRCDLYVSLAKDKEFTTQYFLIPPMGKGRGYTVNFSNLVFGNSVSINDLEYVALVPFPYNLLKSVHKDISRVNTHSDTPYSPNSANSSLGGSLLVYNQSFESGWIAWCGLKPCKTKHVMVNNWANGWVFYNPQEGKELMLGKNVIVFFWPQILEYFGFLVLIGWVFYTFRGFSLGKK